MWVYCKKDTSCITGKWWPKFVLIKKCVSFRTASIILSIPLCKHKHMHILYTHTHTHTHTHMYVYIT
jgi:hypothetical protein